MNNDYKKGFEDGVRCFAWWKDGVQMVGTCGTTLERALSGVENRHGFSPPQSPQKEVTLQHGETGRLLVWKTNKPIPKGYAVTLWHGAQPCGDCDPCLGGRPDQCAVMPTNPKERYDKPLRREDFTPEPAKDCRRVQCEAIALKIYEQLDHIDMEANYAGQVQQCEEAVTGEWCLKVADIIQKELEWTNPTSSSL